VIDVIGKVALVVDVKVSSLAQPTNGVCFGAWDCWKLKSVDDIDQVHIILATIANNEL